MPTTFDSLPWELMLTIVSHLDCLTFTALLQVSRPVQQRCVQVDHTSDDFVDLTELFVPFFAPTVSALVKKVKPEDVEQDPERFHGLILLHEFPPYHEQAAVHWLEDFLPYNPSVLPNVYFIYVGVYVDHLVRGWPQELASHSIHPVIQLIRQSKEHSSLFVDLACALKHNEREQLDVSAIDTATSATLLSRSDISKVFKGTETYSYEYSVSWWDIVPTLKALDLTVCFVDRVDLYFSDLEVFNLTITNFHTVPHERRRPRAYDKPSLLFYAPKLRQFHVRYYGETPSIHMQFKWLGSKRPEFVSIMNCSGGFQPATCYYGEFNVSAKTLLVRDVPLTSLTKSLQHNDGDMTLVIVNAMNCPKEYGLEIQAPSLRGLCVINSTPRYILPVFTRTQGKLKNVAIYNFTKGRYNLLNGLIERNCSGHKLESLVLDIDLPLHQVGHSYAHPTLSTSDLAIIRSCIRLKVLVIKGCFFGHRNEAIRRGAKWWQPSGVLDTLRTWLWSLPPVHLVYCAFVPNLKSESVYTSFANLFHDLPEHRYVYRAIMETYDYRAELGDEYDSLHLPVFFGDYFNTPISNSCWKFILRNWRTRAESEER